MARRQKPRYRPEWPWESFDPAWLVQRCLNQFPEEEALRHALADCRVGRRNNCCDDRVCGYQFFGEGHPDQSRRTQTTFKKGSILLDDSSDKFGDVAIDVREDGQVGAIEFV